MLETLLNFSLKINEVRVLISHTLIMDFLAEFFKPKKKKRTRRRRRRKSRKARGQPTKTELPGPPKLTRTVGKTATARPATKTTRIASPVAAALVMPTLARQQATTLSVVPPVAVPAQASYPQKKKSVRKVKRRVPLPPHKRKGPIKRY